MSPKDRQAMIERARNDPHARNHGLGSPEGGIDDDEDDDLDGDDHEDGDDEGDDEYMGGGRRPHRMDPLAGDLDYDDRERLKRAQREVDAVKPIKPGVCGVDGCEHGKHGNCYQQIRLCVVDEVRFHPRRRDMIVCGPNCRYRKYRASRSLRAGSDISEERFAGLMREHERRKATDLAIVSAYRSKADEHERRAEDHTASAKRLRDKAATLETEIASRQPPTPGAPAPAAEPPKPWPFAGACPECGHDVIACEDGLSGKPLAVDSNMLPASATGTVFLIRSPDGPLPVAFTKRERVPAVFLNCQGTEGNFRRHMCPKTDTSKWYCTKACGRGPWDDGDEPDACQCGGNLTFTSAPPKGPEGWQRPTDRRSAKEQAKRRK